MRLRLIIPLRSRQQHYWPSLGGLLAKSEDIYCRSQRYSARCTFVFGLCQQTVICERKQM